MRFLAVLALLSLSAAAVLAGDAASAAIRLGPGVSLVPASSSTPLSVSASTSDLCPVIAYGASVDVLPSSDLAQLKLTAGSKGLYAQHAESNAAAQAKPYKVTISPIKYANNNTQPSVDWIDLHFKSVSTLAAAGSISPAQSVKMLRSASMSSSHSAMSPMSEMGSMMPMAAPGSSFSFGPIFLSPNDELYFAMTICASMIDCDTATHRFKPAEAEEQTQAQLRQQQQQQQEQMMQQQQQQQVQEQQQLQGQESVRLGLSPRAQSDQQPQPIQQQQQQQQLDACPAIAYTHKLDCGDVTCKVSFVNLSPSKPLDWVDLHVVKADSASLNQLLSIGSTQPHAAALREAQIEQFNYQMTLAAGAQPRMMQHSSASSMMPMRSSVGSQSADRLSNALSLQKFGAASLPESVLAEAGGSQVFQFELPIEFKGGDCDTELAFYKLKETGEAMHEQSMEQQHKLGIGAQSQSQQQQSSSAIGQDTSIEQISQQQKQHSISAPRGFRGSLNQERDL